MIVDVVLAALALISVITGYRAGLLKSLFSLIGYLAGGIAGFYIALNHLTGLEHLWNTVLGSIIAIIGCALIGRFLGIKLAQLMRATIIRGPLRFLDSLLGAALELTRLVVISYIVLSLLLLSPSSTIRNAIDSSTIFVKMETALPGIVTNLKERFHTKEINELRQFEPNELKKLQLN